MAKLLTIPEMLQIARDSEMPGAEAQISMFTALASNLANMLAKHLNVDCGAASYESPDLLGICAPFYAKDENQAPPGALAFYDEHEWSTKEGREAKQ